MITHDLYVVKAMLRRISERNRLLPSEVFHRLERSTINLLAIKNVARLPNHHAEAYFRDSAKVIELGLFASRRLWKLM